MNLNPSHVPSNLERTRREIQLELRKIDNELHEAYENAKRLHHEFLMSIAQKRQREGLPSSKSIEAIARE